MKKFLLAIIVFISFNSYAQQGWYQLPTNVNSWISDVNFINENTGWAVTDSSRVLKTTNGGLNWSIQSINEAVRIQFRFIKFQNPNTGYIGGGETTPTTLYGKKYLYKTTNQGLNWNVIKMDSAYGTVSYDLIQLVNPDIFYISTSVFADMNGYGYIEKSRDGGASFILTGEAEGTPVSMSFINEQFGWICTRTLSDMINHNKSYIHKTTDSGISWVNLLCDSVHTNQYTCISFANISTGYAISAFSKNGYESTRIYKTSDGGFSWDSSGYRNFRKTSMFIVDPNNVFICGSYDTDTSSIAKTTNGGLSWTPQYRRHTVYLNKIFFINAQTGYTFGSNGVILKTTNGGEVYIKNISTDIPSNFNLSFNYPNPFNPITRIKFDVPDAHKGGKFDNSNVVLKVIDVIGREIETLVNESLNPGTYEVTFDGSRYSSGVYFYRLQAGSFTETKKMILLK
jgi:photosystem II stability/assembly factor-like uncharacterized protein